jgi:hypothetical protein
MYAAYRLLHRILGRWGSRWKVYGPQDWGALAVLLLILDGVAFFLLQSSTATAAFRSIMPTFLAWS